MAFLQVADAVVERGRQDHAQAGFGRARASAALAWISGGVYVAIVDVHRRAVAQDLREVVHLGSACTTCTASKTCAAGGGAGAGGVRSEVLVPCVYVISNYVV